MAMKTYIQTFFEIEMIIWYIVCIQHAHGEGSQGYHRQFTCVCVDVAKCAKLLGINDFLF